jgi:hypothetical protein
MALNIDDNINEEKIEAGHLRQVAIGLVDIVLALLLVTLLLVYQTPQPLYQLIFPVNSTLLVILWLVFYRLVTLLLFNGTIGMKLFGVVLLNSEQQPLSLKEKMLAAVFILYKGVDYYH